MGPGAKSQEPRWSKPRAEGSSPRRGRDPAGVGGRPEARGASVRDTVVRPEARGASVRDTVVRPEAGGASVRDTGELRSQQEPEHAERVESQWTRREETPDVPEEPEMVAPRQEGPGRVRQHRHGEAGRFVSHRPSDLGEVWDCPACPAVPDVTVTRSDARAS